MENNTEVIDELKDVVLAEEDEKNVAPQRSADFGCTDEETTELLDENDNE